MVQFRGSRSIKSIMENVPETPRITWKRKRSNNTVEYATEDGSQYIRLHDTDIIAFTPNGRIILNSGGWQTPTTKDRMNNFLPEASIWQKDSVWYLRKNGEDYVYTDGITIEPDGRVLGASTKKDLSLIKRDIARYVDGYCNELFSGNMDAPSAGDCWYCHVCDVETGTPMGELSKDNTHILHHMKEKYYVPSLVVNAVKDIGVSRAAMHHLGYLFYTHNQKVEWWEGIAEQQIRRALTRYLRKQLGLAR